MDRVHVEIQEVGEEGLESSVEVDGIIERKHFFKVDVYVNVFKRGIERVCIPFPHPNNKVAMRFLILFLGTI